MGVDRAWIKSRNPAHRPGHTDISQELIGHIPESGEGETVAVIRLHVNVKIPDRLLSRHRNESAANLVFQITASLQPEKANKLPVLGSQETQRVVAKPTSDNIWRPRKLAHQGMMRTYMFYDDGRAPIGWQELLFRDRLGDKIVLPHFNFIATDLANGPRNKIKKGIGPAHVHKEALKSSQ